MSELCRRYGVTRTGYYAWKRRGLTTHDEQDRWLLNRIVAVYQASDGTYGSPRIQRALAQAGCRVTAKRVARLMRENGLKARAAKLSAQWIPLFVFCTRNSTLSLGVAGAVLSILSLCGDYGTVEAQDAEPVATPAPSIEIFSLTLDRIHGGLPRATSA